MQPDYTSPDGRIKFYNCSYEELFKMGKTWDLAIVDPPYGIGITKNKRLNNNSKKDWDNEIPPPEYFEQIFRVSKNQIIWGGNYFIEHLKNSRCFINWDKLNHSDTYADCEMAWVSFDMNAKIIKYMWDGNRYGFEGNIKGVGKPTIRTHPTQKPIALYHWQLKNYAKPNESIIDTHGGSMSHAIAVHDVNIALDMNLTLDICEIDTNYFNDAVKRFRTHIAQKQLF